MIDQEPAPQILRGTAGRHSDDPSGTPTTCSRYIRDKGESNRREELVQAGLSPSFRDSGWHKCGRFRVRIALVAGEPGGQRRNWLSDLCFGKRGKK